MFRAAQTLALRAYAARADMIAPGFLLWIFLNLIAKPMRQFGSQRTGYAETQLVIDLLNRMRQQDVASNPMVGYLLCRRFV